MKHLFLLALLSVGFYVGWQFLSEGARAYFKMLTKKHLTKVAIIVTILFLLFFAAVQTPSFQLF
jgi:hypothetical protein